MFALSEQKSCSRFRSKNPSGSIICGKAQQIIELAFITFLCGCQTEQLYSIAGLMSEI